MSQDNHRLPGTLQHGVVVKFDAGKGYGFIRPQDAAGARTGERDVFVHVRNVAGRHALMPGQPVTYYLAHTEKGPAAVKVQAGSVLSTPYLKYTAIGLGSALLLLFGLAAVAGASASLALWLALWVMAVSIAGFGIYGYDKAQAEAGRTRVPEVVLHGLSLLGGSPGAFAGMRLFHHKTSKPAFQAIFWLIVAVQVGALLFLALNR